MYNVETQDAEARRTFVMPMSTRLSHLSQPRKITFFSLTGRIPTQSEQLNLPSINTDAPHPPDNVAKVYFFYKQTFRLPNLHSLTTTKKS